MLPLSLLQHHSSLITLMFELLHLKPTHLIFLQPMLLFGLPDGVTLKLADQPLSPLCCWLISHISTSLNAMPFITLLSCLEIKFVPEEMHLKILAKETVVVLSSPQQTLLILLMPKSSESFLLDHKIVPLLELPECTLTFPDMQMLSFKQLSDNLHQFQLHLQLLHL